MGAAIHLLPHLSDKHAARGVVPLALAALGIGTFVGRVACGALLDRVEGRYVAFGAFLLGAAGIGWMAVLPEAPTAGQVAIAPFLFGVAMGSESDTLAYLVRRYCGVAYFPSIYNRLLIAYFAGTLCGPVLIGMTFDRTGNSFTALAGLAVGCVVAALIALRLPSTRSTAYAAA
jgi:predicted MFS family arabinose efflux permease